MYNISITLTVRQWDSEAIFPKDREGRRGGKGQGMKGKKQDKRKIN